MFWYKQLKNKPRFVWNSDLERNSTGSLIDWLHSISTRCIDLTVYFNVPLSHMLFNPSARRQNFCELLKSNDGETFDAILRRKLSMLLGKILKLQSLKLLVSLGHPYCCPGPSSQICGPNQKPTTNLRTFNLLIIHYSNKFRHIHNTY